MKNIFKAVWVIIGTIIGAGFATGQEIYLFFGKFGKVGYLSIVFSSILFGIIIYKTLHFAEKNNITEYNTFLELALKKRKSKVLNVVSLIVILFLGVTFIVMCAGMGAYLFQELGVPKWIGAAIMSIVSFIILQGRTKGIVKLNEIAIPFLICIILLLAIFNIRKNTKYTKFKYWKQHNKCSIVC